MKKIAEKRPDGSLRVKLVFERKTKTQQHMSDATDINRIMARYLKNGGSLEKLPDPFGAYADLSDLGDFQENMNKVAHATYLFNLLPAKLREELRNDPSKLEPWLQDPDNHPRAVKMGLMKPKPPAVTNDKFQTTKDGKLTEPSPASAQKTKTGE